jgi:DNA-binding CsgD family transcriptional regulator
VADPHAARRRVHGANLTGREKEVLLLVIDGYSTRQICEKMGITPRTVQQHLRGVLAKAGVKRRDDLLAWYIHEYLPRMSMKALPEQVALGLADLSAGIQLAAGYKAANTLYAMLAVGARTDGCVDHMIGTLSDRRHMHATLGQIAAGLDFLEDEIRAARKWLVTQIDIGAAI